MNSLAKSIINMNVLIGVLIGTVSLQFLIQNVVATSPARPDYCICPAIYLPVCGDNDITYSNQCVLNCASKENIRRGYPPIKVAYKGECNRSNCLCAVPISPVCGTDGQTYIHTCELACRNRQRKELGLPVVKKDYDGECLKGPNCPWIFMPVCGTDGRTYRNICYLQYESRRNVIKGLPPIYFKSIGPCKQDACVCQQINDPVCASNGKTYGNKCEFDCENRRRKELGQPLLTIRYKGECKVDCGCTFEYNPVCGSDGNTYPNVCVLNCENLERLHKSLPLLLIDYFGECRNCYCPLYVDPTCGSDGVTYSNPCFLECENEKRGRQHLPPINEVECSDYSCDD